MIIAFSLEARHTVSSNIKQRIFTLLSLDYCDPIFSSVSRWRAFSHFMQFCTSGYNMLMAKSPSIAIYVIMMIVTVVAVDILFFRHHFLARLISNIGIVLVYIAFYLRFLNHS